MSRSDVDREAGAADDETNEDATGTDGSEVDADAPSDDPDSALDREELTARLDLLREENERLRREYARARRSQYRQTALGLALVGLLALGGGVLFAGSRVVLFALAGTGLFAAVLTYYLTPERLVPVSVGRTVYESLAGGLDAISADLGLAGDRVYVPASPDPDRDGRGGSDASGSVRLFLPHRSSFTLPSGEELDPGFVVTETTSERGLALAPTGGRLFDEFERAATGSVATEPDRLATQLADALVEQFELAESVDTDLALDTVTGSETEGDPETGGETVFVAGVDGSAYGPVDRLDHPLVSFLAVGATRSLDRPITVSVVEGDDRFDAVVAIEAYGDGNGGGESEREEDEGLRNDGTDARDADTGTDERDPGA